MSTGPMRQMAWDEVVAENATLRSALAAKERENEKLRGVVEAVESELNCLQDAEPTKGNAPIRAARAIIHLYKTAALSKGGDDADPS